MSLSAKNLDINSSQMVKIAKRQGMRILPFSYRLYNFILIPKFLEVTMKKFIKFVLLSSDYQKKRFFWERLGAVSSVSMANGKKKWIWIHANAIGEVNTCPTLIRLIKDRYPAHPILLTTSNFSADKRAAQLNLADKIMFFPYDLPFIIKRYLKIFEPLAIIVIECDIWPNFVKICKERKIPVLVVSSVYKNDYSRSLGLRYLYNYTFRLSADVLKNIDCFCMQTEDDARRLSSVVLRHENINVTGNLKFSNLNTNSLTQEKPYYQRLFNIKETDPVFIAGNVHKPEGKMIIDAFKLVKEKIADAVMILAPRFIEDLSYFESILLSKRLRYMKRTNLDIHERTDDSVIILDTMGELAKVYSVAKTAFVGGSLVYLGEMFGGHNILEPAQFGVPVMFGPYMHNFQNLAELFLQKKIGIRVKDAQGLADSTVFLLQDAASREYIELKIHQILKTQGHVAEKTFDFIKPFFKTDSFAMGYPDKCEVCEGEDFRFLLRQERYKIYRCRRCRLVFSHPIPSAEELNAFYQNFSYNQFQSMYAKENAEIGEYVTKAQLDLLRRWGEDIRGGRFLDIGCGNGYYLYGAKVAGFEAVGVEKDKAAAEYARNNYNLQVNSCNLEDCGFPDAYFDIVKMRQLIEHLRYPNEYLQEVWRILKPAGILIVETANTDSLETIPRLYFLDAFKKIESSTSELSLAKKLFLSFRREWAFTDPPRHLYGFSKDNLRALLTKNGFYCLKTLTAAMGDKVHYPISQGHRDFLRKGERETLIRLYQKSKIKYLTFRFIFKPIMEVFRLYIKLFGLGSHLVVYAKKKN